MTAIEQLVYRWAVYITDHHGIEHLVPDGTTLEDGYAYAAELGVDWSLVTRKHA